MDATCPKYIARIEHAELPLAEHACDNRSSLGMVTTEACHCTHQIVVILTEMAIALLVTMFHAGDWSPICIFAVQHMDSLFNLSTLCHLRCRNVQWCCLWLCRQVLGMLQGSSHPNAVRIMQIITGWASSKDIIL